MNCRIDGERIRLSDALVPVDLVEQRGSNWFTNPLLPRVEPAGTDALVGNQIQFMLPLEVDKRRLEYVFIFTIKKVSVKPLEGWDDIPSKERPRLRGSLPFLPSH